LRIAHHDSSTSSVVLNVHTNRNGLSGPIQLTSEKLKIRISTLTISIERRFGATSAFKARSTAIL
jgi:hypothetical protein